MRDENGRLLHIVMDWEVHGDKLTGYVDGSGIGGVGYTFSASQHGWVASRNGEPFFVLGGRCFKGKIWEQDCRACDAQDCINFSGIQRDVS